MSDEINIRDQDYMSGEAYPMVIIGHPLTDDFFDANPDIRMYEGMEDFRIKNGKKKSSKIMWAHCYLLDPRTFIFNKMTFEERKSWINKNYHDFDWKEHDYVKWYQENILIDREICLLVNMERKQEEDLESGKKLNVKLFYENEGLLKKKRNDVYKKVNKRRRRKAAGSSQPGGARDLVKY